VVDHVKHRSSSNAMLARALRELDLLNLHCVTHNLLASTKTGLTDDTCHSPRRTSRIHSHSTSGGAQAGLNFSDPLKPAATANRRFRFPISGLSHFLGLARTN